MDSTQTTLNSHNRQASHGQMLGMLGRTYQHVTKLKTADPNDDKEVLAKVKHTMRPKEKLMSWYARTGIGRAQVLELDRDEIARRVSLAEERQKNEMLPPPEFFEPARPPQHFTIAVDTWE